YRYAAGKLIRRSFDPGRTNVLVTSIAESPDGTTWLGTRQGLLSWAKDSRSAVPLGLEDKRISCQLPIEGRKLWIGTGAGLVRWDDNGITQNGIPEPLRTAVILSIAKDRESNVWVATPKKLARINTRGFAAVDTTDKMPITVLFEDREGNLWGGG